MTMIAQKANMIKYFTFSATAVINNQVDLLRLDDEFLNRNIIINLKLNI